MKRQDASSYGAGRRLAVGIVVLAALAASAAPARAGVVQQVTTEFNPAFGAPLFDQDSVFALNSADITTNIFANVSPGPFDSVATASAGSLGQVGLAMRMISRGTLTSEVLVASDEFVNLFGSPAAVRANFIIDGGQLADFFSRDARVTFSLEVGAEHVGTAGAIQDESSMTFAGRSAAAFGGAGGFFPGFFGGSYLLDMIVDPSGNRTVTETIFGGLDLEPTVTGGNVEIPFSLQSVDLGVLPPGERLLLGYRASIDIAVDGATEGILAAFSDPFGLTGDAIRQSLIFTPLVAQVPAPATLPLVALGLALLLGRRRRLTAA